MSQELKMNQAGETVEDPTCLEVIEQSVVDEDGIIQVDVDTEKALVSFDYDPAQASEADIERVAARLSPTLESRWRNCTMRLGKVGGRACESCALRLEREVKELNGVRRATASYAGGVLSISYDEELTSLPELAHQVKQLGARVQPSASEILEEAAEEEQRPSPGDRFWGWMEAHQMEAVFTAVTLIAMLGGLAAERLEAPPVAATALFVIAYIAGGTFGLKAGVESLRERVIDVDLLMILAAVGAALVGQPFEGAMLLFLFSLSNVLQEFALGRTRNAIKALMKLRPSQALVRRGDKTVTLPIERINIGDRIIVKPGERIALDGIIVEGESSVDQSSITGESMPVDKEEGDTVFAGTINKNGGLEVGVTRLAKDSTIAKLIQMVEEAQSEKAETQRFIDTAEQYYAQGVILFTALVALLPLLWGEPFADAFYRAMTVMVAASPCAIVISTPATVLSAIGNGARRGVLFKGGAYVENAATIKAIAFDKTGTLTVGKPEVTDVVVVDGAQGHGRIKTEDDLLALAAAAEARSEHPLAEAVVAAAEARGLTLAEASDFQAVTGKGVQATVSGLQVHIGSPRYFEAFVCEGLDTAVTAVNRLQTEGKTAILVAHMRDGSAHILGILAFADALRPDAPQVVEALHKVGVKHIVMLTGDNEEVAKRIAAQAGVDHVFADLLPEDKVDAIKEVQAKYGVTAMIGDGVNDAPALATADIGMAMGAAGTDVALETADIVLMSDDLRNLPYVIELSRRTRRTLLVNLGFAIFMILVMLATIFVSGLALPAAVIGHEGGTVLVSLNGMRLLGFKPKALPVS